MPSIKGPSNTKHPMVLLIGFRFTIFVPQIRGERARSIRNVVFDGLASKNLDDIVYINISECLDYIFFLDRKFS